MRFIDMIRELSLIDPAMFHGNRTFMSPLPDDAPPQMIPRESQDSNVNRMLPVTPWAPPVPTRNPGLASPDHTRGVIPHGGFGVTGPATGTQLESRIKGQPSQNPFVAPRGGFFQPAQNIINVPPRNPVDTAVEQAAMLLMPLGRLGAGVKASRGLAKAAADLAYSPQQWAQMARSGMNQFHRSPRGGYRNVADDAVPTRGATKFTPAEPSKSSSLTEELRQAHARVLKGNPRTAKDIAPYSAAEKRRVREAALKRRDQGNLVNQLTRKGQLDANTGRLIYGY